MNKVLFAALWLIGAAGCTIEEVDVPVQETPAPVEESANTYQSPDHNDGDVCGVDDITDDFGNHVEIPLPCDPYYKEKGRPVDKYTEQQELGNPSPESVVGIPI